MLPMFDPNDNEAGMKLLEDLTTNAHHFQQQALKEILSNNAATEYLSSFLNGYSDMKLFKERVPIVKYEDIKPFINRIANGESSNIISAQPITELLTSSGTSGGQPKMMPSTHEELERKTFFYNLLVPIMNKYVGGLDQGKAMYLLFVKPEVSTPSGLRARPVLTSYYKSDNFRKRPFNRYNVYTSPDETILCDDTKQSMYCQLLCGLLERDHVLRVGAVFASAFLRAIKFLEDHWEELCCNIRSAQLSQWISDPTCLYRYRVGDILRVSGFHNKAPQFRFVQRRNVVLSIDADKTNEEDLLQAVGKAKEVVEAVGFLVTEYSSYADTSSIPGHYVLFWELKSKSGGAYSELELNQDVMEECCWRVEESLDSVYRRCRAKDKSIGALEIRVVKEGSFDALMDFCVSQGSSLNQYKTPRCIKYDSGIKILESRVVARFFSQKLPSWEPPCF
ncbi:hypothetical protein CsatA_012373 [Cannabis sativa]